MKAPQAYALTGSGRAVGSGLALSPEWLRTKTGGIAMGIGVVLVGLKAAGMASWLPPAKAEAGLAAVAVGAAAFSLFHLASAIKAARANRRLRIAWWCFAWAVALAGAAAGLAGAAPFAAPDLLASWPLLAQWIQLASFALLLTGTLALPTERLPRRLWVSTTLDIATVMMAALIGFWIYGFGSSQTDTPLPAAALAAIIAYGVLSLGQLSALLLFFYRPKEASLQRRFPVLAAGSVFLVIIGALPNCTALRVDGLAAQTSVIGSTLFALALAITSRRMGGPVQPPTEPGAKRNQLGVPFASTTLVGLLLGTSLISRDLWQNQAAVLLPALFVTLLLIVVRQTLTARDNYRLAEEMKRAKETAESANAARLHFLANISHDLRTPLNGVLGCAQILLRDTAINPKQRELVKTMQGSAEHLRNLINDLLDLSKLEADRLELAPVEFDLAAFLGDLLKPFALEAEKKQLLLELRPTPDLPSWIRCDRKRLQQVLGNLIHNALKFTDRGSVIVRASRVGPMLAVEVADTGCGIMPDQLADLFQPFHVVNERSIKLEGTGLGLSICKKLAQRMGGDISVQSIISKGSAFTVRIPLEEATPVIEVQRTIVDYTGRRRRILIVDDQPANRVVLRTMLEPLDFLVDEAGDADAALDQLRFAKPDVVLLDLMMPGVDGFALRAQIGALALAPEPPCIAVSAMSGDEVDTRCEQAGFRQLLHKPVNLDLLLEALRVHAGIEWVYGVIQPAPVKRESDAAEEMPPAPLVLPPSETLIELLDLARRGFVRNLENQAVELARKDARFAPFAERVGQLAREFKLRELADWLASLSN